VKESRAMNFSPLLHASLAIQIHVATVVPAFFLGAWQIFLSTKGWPLHRRLGSVYIGLMVVAAISALFIRATSVPGMPNFGGFTPIHLFVPVVFGNVGLTLFALQTRRFKLHRATMMGLFISGIGVAGTLAFMPGRIMHAVVFG
jgi:uncharacterized membrane protein